MTTLSVLDAAREMPRGLAILDGEVRITFQELAERVRARMQAFSILVEDGSSSPHLVAVETDEGLPTLESLLALLELGQPFLPLHPRLTLPERNQLLERLPVTWLLKRTDGGAGELERRDPPRDDEAATLLSAAPQLAALATSGSSGAPRVALLSRRAFLASAAASAANLGWRADDSWLLCLPLAHVGGLSVMTRCLIARKPVILVPPRAGKSSTERLALSIAESHPSLMSLVPSQLHGLLEREPRHEMPGSVRAILTGGAAASPRLLGDCADRGWPVLTSYGLTEACSQVTTQRPGTTNRGELGAGRPLSGIVARLEGDVICISGPTLFSGYLGGGPAEPCDVELGLRTRDLGRFDRDGNLHVFGRVDDLIITGGENVAPWEVEAVLEACPGVLEACVFGVRDARWGEVVAAGLRTEPKTNEARASLSILAAAHQACEHHLAAFKRPRFYTCSSRFSHTSTGKLDRRATARDLTPELCRAPLPFER